MQANRTAVPQAYVRYLYSGQDIRLKVVTKRGWETGGCRQSDIQARLQHRSAHKHAITGRYYCTKSSMSMNGE